MKCRVDSIYTNFSYNTLSQNVLRYADVASPNVSDLNISVRVEELCRISAQYSNLIIFNLDAYHDGPLRPLDQGRIEWAFRLVYGIPHPTIHLESPSCRRLS